MEDPVKDAELKGKISDAWEAYALASTDDERDHILFRIGNLEAERCLVAPIEEIQAGNRRVGITQAMVKAMMAELHRRFPAIIKPPEAELADSVEKDKFSKEGGG